MAAALFFSAAPTVAPAQAGAPSPDKIKLCESCHGPNGNSTTAGIPSIAAQPTTFLENQLVYFREELRNAPVMQGIVKGMKDEDFTALARHFGKQKATVVSTARPNPSTMKLGAEIAAARHCGQCHQRTFEGREQVPRLAGQREEYLYDAMIGYRDGKRSGADTTMTEVLYGMSDADIRAMAHFMARLD